MARELKCPGCGHDISQHKVSAEIRDHNTCLLCQNRPCSYLQDDIWAAYYTENVVNFHTSVILGTMEIRFIFNNGGFYFTMKDSMDTKDLVAQLRDAANQIERLMLVKGYQRMHVNPGTTDIQKQKGI